MAKLTVVYRFVDRRCRASKNLNGHSPQTSANTDQNLTSRGTTRIPNPDRPALTTIVGGTGYASV
ncbi:hypothetical protein PTTG_28355 [Puccinia triticina 1-1 BBBD Race 1]|uniref:Uncharacterized protein n=1 Tax=Puccinia triticina (isolate 1-1 / race 1 (BBBD)) TaxID=630390 RepID=A0A180GCD7_PUCT1|nr:hypothetical protein PTTG_28355 [Puccinia triticina 1-1 BBBD Race 1]